MLLPGQHGTENTMKHIVSSMVPGEGGGGELLHVGRLHGSGKDGGWLPLRFRPLLQSPDGSRSTVDT